MFLGRMGNHTEALWHYPHLYIIDLKLKFLSKGNIFMYSFP